MKTKVKNFPQKVVKILLITVGIILAVLLIGFIVLLSWSTGKTKPFLDENAKVLAGSVSEITQVEIGGIEQGMIIKGKNDQNPVLLFLHGGPGSPEYPFYDKAYKSADVGLEDYFTVCWWDQRGSGMSYNSAIPLESMTLEQMVADTVEVTNYLRERFGQDKIYVMGHSWGTLLGPHTVAQYPELYEAYIGIGQMKNAFEGEKIAYDYMLESAKALGDEKMLKDLSSISINSPESLNKEYFTIRGSSLNKLGAGDSHKPQSTFRGLILPLLQCREYTIGQKIDYIKGNLFSLPLLQSIVTRDLSSEVPKLDVPVYILQGAYDYQTPYPLAKEYYDNLEAPFKQFYTFENSAHCPIFEEPEKFIRIIKEDILRK